MARGKGLAAIEAAVSISEFASKLMKSSAIRCAQFWEQRCSKGLHTNLNLRQRK